MSGKALPLLLVLGAITGLAMLANQAVRDHQPPKSETPITVRAAAMTATPSPSPATGRIAPSKQSDVAPAIGSRKLALPDGTFVDSLNDTVDAPPLTTYWGPFDWSPILGIERSSAGIDWYKHADGSYSTTQMVWRQDLGRHEAMTRVAHPGPAPASPAPAKPR